MTDEKRNNPDEINKKKRRRRRGKRKKEPSNVQRQTPDQSFNQKLRELVKKYKGFDPWEKEHKAKSEIEREVCKFLDESGLEHKHRGKRFNVVLRSNKAVVFEPDIIIPHPRINDRPVVIQAIHAGNQDDLVPVLGEFKKQLGSKYFIVVVTRKDDLTNIPSELCDLLVAVEYASSLPSQLRAQAKS